MELSIIIPTYNESRKISRDILEASYFLTKQHITGEIIVADDGSTDSTHEVAEKIIIPPSILLTVLHSQTNQGKGRAVRQGILSSQGDFVMFADSGHCTPFADALKGLDMIKKGMCRIAHGSRKLPDSHIPKKQSLYRRIGSCFFRRLILRMMNLPDYLTDTQCGFKIYQGYIARRLYQQCFTDGFMFDIEIIIRALQAGYSIKEFPIEWTWDPDSRLSPMRSWRQILRELRLIKKRLVKKI
ncbi:MAG: glycosyltransferase [Sedimentisphaerales bacterium]|nr:glycosyltransferase [Sedimentisphaerales bacterium]